MAYGVHEERYPLPIAAVDTHRPKPSKKARAEAEVEASAAGPGPGPGAAPARDYFGDAKIRTKSDADRKEEQQVQEHSAAVVEALEGAKAGDDLEPKVVKMA